MGSFHKTEENLGFLNDNAPCFAICGNKVQVLEKPAEFYKFLIEGIKSSKQRIVLSALYLGTGNLEKQLVNCLQDTLKKREQENISMDVDILFDYVRGSRGLINTTTMLQPLVEQYCNPDKQSKTKLGVFLYHTPFLRGFWKKALPARFNEVIGINHLKIFIFDDTFLISGANLSEDYFTQRQDRYVAFKDCHELSNYYHSLVKAVSTFSFNLEHTGNIIFANQCPHPFTGDLNLFVDFVASALNNVMHSCDKQTVPKESFDLQESSNNSDIDILNLKKELVGCSKIKHSHSCIKQRLTSGENKEYVLDTFVYPTVQFGFVGVHQDENVTKQLLESFCADSCVSFTSGYFNVTDAYCEKILKSVANFDIITASPEANGFLSAHGLAGKIPSVYVHLTKTFFDQVLKKERADNIKIWEYIRPNWTYHAKGLWYYKHNKSYPSLSVVGSSNFGLRSTTRDLESQITIVTKNTCLMKQLQREKCNLMKWSNLITSETFRQPRYAVTPWVSLITSLIKHFF